MKKSYLWCVLIFFTAKAVVFNKANVDDITSKCFSVPETLCVDGESNTEVYTADNMEPHLVGKFTFDDLYPIDKSGNGNHIHPVAKSGPGYSGSGGSLFLDSNTSNLRILNSSSLQSRTMTICFWVYLMYDSTGHYRNIIHKGSDDTEMTPTIMFDMGKRNIAVRVSTTSHWEEGPVSMGRVPLRRWTHVAVSISQETVKIILNGVLDTTWQLSGSVLTNSGDIFLGQHSRRDGFEGFLDDLYIYDVALPLEKIQALITPVMTGILDYNSVVVGCLHCTYAEAVSSCPNGRHICTKQENRLQGHHLTRINGLGKDSASEPWSKDTPAEARSAKRLGLCCLDAETKSQEDL